MKEFIGAADLYITPYLNEAQITSGTLAYTFGSGKAVISTPYWHAAELLADDRGVLVPFADAPAIAREVKALLGDDTRRHTMRKNAYRIGRDMIWSRTAERYMRSFELSRLEAAPPARKSIAMKTLAQKPRELPDLVLSHLSRMTDSTGVFQHAIFSVPTSRKAIARTTTPGLRSCRPNERAWRGARQRLGLGHHQRGFLHHAFDTKSGRFHNHMSFDRRWLDDKGSEDCHGPRPMGTRHRGRPVPRPEFPDDGGPTFPSKPCRFSRSSPPRALGHSVSLEFMNTSAASVATAWSTKPATC